MSFKGWDGQPEDPDQVYVKIYNSNKQLLENINISANKINTGVYEYIHTFETQDTIIIEFSSSVGTTKSNLRFVANARFI